MHELLHPRSVAHALAVHARAHLAAHEHLLLHLLRRLRAVLAMHLRERVGRAKRDRDDRRDRRRRQPSLERTPVLHDDPSIGTPGRGVWKGARGAYSLISFHAPPRNFRLIAIAASVA